METFTQEQKMLRDKMRKFCHEKVAGRAAEADETGEYPWDLHQLFMDSGFFNMRVPTEYGGKAMDFTSCCIILEELTRVDGALGIEVAHHQSGMCCFMDGASRGQREKFLPRIGRGDFLVGFVLTEPDAGSDAFSLKTEAVADGNDYVINGSKCFISNGWITDLYVVFATVNPDLRRNGITAFLVEKETQGFRIGEAEKKLGFRVQPTCPLIFEDMRVPKDNVLGEAGKGWEIVLHSLTESRIQIAVMSLGIAQGAMEVAVSYAKKREQFGQPIGNFQDVSFMLADMAIQVECARALIYKIASMVDMGQGQKQHYFASIAKCFASDMALKVTTDAVQVLGGYGHTKEYPVEKMMRDAMAMPIIEGTNQIQRLQIAKNLMKIY